MEPVSFGDALPCFDHHVLIKSVVNACFKRGFIWNVSQKHSHSSHLQSYLNLLIF